MQAGKVILGYCKLREKHIADTTIGLEHCKDRAVIDLNERGQSRDFIDKVLQEDGIKDGRIIPSGEQDSAAGEKESEISELLQTPDRNASAGKPEMQTKGEDGQELRAKKLSKEEEIIRKAVWG